MRFRWIIALIFCLLCLTGCSQAETSRFFPCQVVLKEGDGFSCAEPARTVEPGTNSSEDSSMDASAALDMYLRENLFPIITEPEDSPWPGTYLYDTDDHLSTEGVEIHTDRIIAQSETEEREGTP